MTTSLQNNLDQLFKITEIYRGDSMNDLYYKEYSKAFFESCFDAVFLTKPNGDIIGANPAACQMFGMTEEELCKAGRNGIVDTEDLRLEQALREREANGNVRAEINFIRKNGTKFSADLTSNIFTTKDGEIMTLIIIRDISVWKDAELALKREKEMLENISIYDYLTKLLNRRGLMKRIEEEIVRADRERTPLSLLMVDMDFFKRINDLYGHLCGDAVLCKVAEIFSENTRPYDILGRFAGDEFLVCLPGTIVAQGREIAERLRESVENAEIEYQGSKIKVTASFGLAAYDPNSKMNIDSLISEADDQMYLAKRKRNSVCWTDVFIGNEKNKQYQ